MSWTALGPWIAIFRQALVNAYTPNALNLLISDYFSKSFVNIAVGPFPLTYPEMVQKQIEEAKMEGWLIDLVAAAQERRPRDSKLREIAEDLGLTLTGPRMDNVTQTPFEAIVRENAQLLNMSELLSGMAVLQGQVCFIDIPNGGGTGFLIGPDLVMTNDHVINSLREGPNREDRLARTRCLFDYKEGLNPVDPQDDPIKLGKKKVTEVKLNLDPQAEDGGWLVDRLPPSDKDWDYRLGDAAELELDFGVIRLEKEIGREPVGGLTGDLDARQRGWIDATIDAPALAAGNQVFLLQHPQGQPLQVSIGQVTGYNGKGTRMRYDANSRYGSSGSPCFNADLQLVAIHHAYDTVNRPPQWNQAIPFGKIRSAWHVDVTSPD
jgi:hypothetical protein